MIDFDNTPPELQQRVLRRDGCPLHFWIGGPETGPLVVFMHGATLDHRMFNAQVAALLPRYRVLVWDTRGHGQSQPIGARFTLEQCAGDMLAILDELGVEQAVFGGQSLGGYIAQHIYIAAPDRVQAMIVIGSTPLAKAYNKLEVWALKASLPLFRVWPYGSFVKTVARNTAQQPSVRAYALQAIQQIDRADFLAIWEAVTLAVDDKGRPGMIIDVPLLLIQGDGDKVGSIRRDMPVWATQEPNVTYHVIPDAGHNANQDNPDATNRFILDFLDSRLGP